MIVKRGRKNLYSFWVPCSITFIHSNFQRTILSAYARIGFVILSLTKYEHDIVDALPFAGHTEPGEVQGDNTQQCFYETISI